MFASRAIPQIHRLLGLALLLTLAGGARGATPGVTVEQSPPQIVRRTYDALHPPEEMLRKLTLPEAGLCQTDFGCKVLAGTDRPGFGLQPTVTSVRLLTHLTITIWTVIQANPKLLAHEEGHRAIWEEYYRRAQPVALEIASRALGTRLAFPLNNGGAAVPDAREALQGKLAAEFLRATAERCVVAQHNFDVITLHGGNQIPEAAAAAQAMAEEQARPRG